MALPGFRAEDSLGPATQHYRMTNYSGFAAADSLVPQQLLDDAADVDADEVGDEENDENSDVPDNEASSEDSTTDQEA